VLVPGGHWTKTDPDSGRLDAEPAVPKIGASASIGTWLGSLLATHGVDTVLVAARRRQDASDRGRRSAGELRHLRALDCLGDRALPPHEQPVRHGGQVR